MTPNISNDAELLRLMAAGDDQAFAVLYRRHRGAIYRFVMKESLGRQVMEGIEVEGTRTTRTIPAGEIGNTLPIQIVMNENEKAFSAYMRREKT